MSTRKYADTPEVEREDMLQANCDYSEEMPIKKHFTPDEITEQRKQFLDNAVILRRAAEVLRAAQDVYKDAIKEPTKDNAYLLQNIRAGFVEVNQQVYLFANHEEGFMEYYDRFGEKLQSRRLTPEERQTKIK